MHQIKKITESEKDWIKEISVKEYGGESCVFLGKKFFIDKLPGFFLEDENLEKKGLITFDINNDVLEIMAFNAFEKFVGFGTELLNKTIEFARNKNIKKIKVLTTNDHLDALRFYQRRGFVIKNIYPNALENDRKIKPEIPEIGDYNIPMRDAIELELKL